MLALIRQNIDAFLIAINRFITSGLAHIKSGFVQLEAFWRQGAHSWLLIVVALLVVLLLLLLRRQRQRQRREALLRRVSQGLSTAASVQELSGLLFETIFALLPASAACLYLARSATGPLVMYAQQHNPAVATSALAQGAGERTQWTPDMWSEPLPPRLTSAIQGHQAILSLPVTLKDHPPALVRLLLLRSQAAAAASAGASFLPLLLAPILARLVVSEQLQRLETRAREATLVTSSSQSLLSAVLAPEALAQMLLDLMARTTASDAGVVLLAPSAVPASPPQILASYAFEPDALRDLLATRDAAGAPLPFQVSSLNTEAGASPLVSSLLHKGFGAFLEVPICLGTDPIGSVSVSKHQETLRDNHQQICIGSVIVLKRQGTFGDNHQQVCQLYAHRLAFTLQNRAYHEAIFRDYREALTLIVAAYEASASHLEGHSSRIARLAVELAMRLGLSSDDVEAIQLAGEFHDIGMVALGEDIVGKPGRLTTQEYDLVKHHPLTGAALTAPIRLPIPIAPAIMHHHERFDGMGYPDGLKGTDIPIAARILALAEYLDAMLTSRNYRQALSLSDAMARLQQAAGTQIDPDVVQACQQLARDNKLAACGWDWL